MLETIRAVVLRSFRWLGPRIVPAALTVAGFGVTIWLGYRSQQPHPPTASESALLVLASGLLNLAAAARFARIGRADPTHARSAVRRLLSTGRALGSIEAVLQEATGAQNVGAMSAAALRATGQLEIVQRNLLDAIEDWNDVHREALREVLRDAGEAQ